MKYFPQVAFLPILAFTLSLATHSPAQDGFVVGDSGFDAGGTAPVEEAGTIETIRFDVEFTDTPVGEAFEYIGDVLELFGAEPLNVVYSGEGEDIVLPSMRLRQITFAQFVSFINRIGGAQPYGEVELERGASPELPPHRGPRFGITEESGIWYFWAESSELDQAAETKGQGMDGINEVNRSGKMPVLRTTVFALEDDIEVTLGLIEETLAESLRYQDRPEPGLKFHEPSSTLIVSATVEDLQIIEEVIQVVTNRAEIERMRAMGVMGSDSGMAQEIQALRMRLEQYERSADHRERAVVEAETQAAVLRAKLEEVLSKYSKDHPAAKEAEERLGKALEAQKEAQ